MISNQYLQSPHHIFHAFAQATAQEKEVRPKRGFGSKPKKEFDSLILEAQKQKMNQGNKITAINFFDLPPQEIFALKESRKKQSKMNFRKF